MLSEPDAHDAYDARDAYTWLLLRVKAGEEAAFGELYSTARRRVVACCWAVLRNEGLAVEAAQETFVDVWRCAADFDPDRGPALPWMLTIARRRAVDLVRSEVAHARRNATYLNDSYVPAMDTTSEVALRRLDQERLAGLVAGLSEFQRQVITLFYFQGLTVQDIAAALGIPRPTVKTRVRDSVVQLRLEFAAA